MGLLDHLWDDTVAGPPPENGLGKLRKHHTFAFRSNSGKGMHACPSNSVQLPQLILSIPKKKNENRNKK